MDSTTMYRGEDKEEEIIFEWRGKRYLIRDEERGEFILSDFHYCVSIGDWDTITNRITNGLKWGWLEEL